MTKVAIGNRVFKKLIDYKEIEGKVQDIANTLKKEYEGKNPLFIILLKGAFMFGADLMKVLDIKCQIEFVKIRSYDGTESTGNITIEQPKELIYENRHVVIIDDLIDTGRTLQVYVNAVQGNNPLSVKTVTLIKKTDALKVDIEIDHFGFEIPNLFIIGYGMDLNEAARNLPHIYQLESEG